MSLQDKIIESLHKEIAKVRRELSEKENQIVISQGNINALEVRLKNKGELIKMYEHNIDALTKQLELNNALQTFNQ